MQDLTAIFSAQQSAFRQSEPPLYSERITNLKKLLTGIERFQERLFDSISADFASNGCGGRSRYETMIAETQIARSDLKYTIKNLRKWMRPRRVSTPIHLLPSNGEILVQPLGVVGIMSPFNYPFQLTIVPLSAALAAGNRVMIKPSELTPRTSKLLAEMLHSLFDPTTVSVISGGPEVAGRFSSLPFDHLFFTGSTAVGKKVARAAAENLTPLTLELGGKSPAIIDDSADLDLSAKRLAVGKLFNSGQTCVAADYILMPEKLIEPFAGKIINYAQELYPTIADNPGYTSIVSLHHYRRLVGLVDDARQKGARIISAGGEPEEALAKSRKIPLTLILDATPEMKVMNEEIFGPLLPVIGANSPRQAIEMVNENERPLALYWFGRDRKNRDQILNATLSGGVCINDTMWHLAHENLPFGGVGASGTGAYHADYGFKTFSHQRAVLYQKRLSGGALLYPPYGKKTDMVLNLLKKLL